MDLILTELELLMKHQYSLICYLIEQNAKKDTKVILMKTQFQEKCRISVILCLTADGDKLPVF